MIESADAIAQKSRHSSKQMKTMKTSIGLTVVGTSLLLAAQSRGQSADKFYLDVNVGGAIPQNSKIQVSPFGNSGDVAFDAGVRGGLALGYHITPSFAAQLESGIVWNNVHSIHGNTISSFPGASAEIYEVPMLADFIYKPLHGAFQPYIGAGVGGAATIFDSSNLPLYGSSFSDTDFTFAYQAQAGFKYAVNSNVELGIAYEFLGTLDHHWSDHGVTFKTDGTMTHAIMATLTWRF